MDFQDKFGREGITFDDVLLVPDASEVLPSEVDLTTRFSKNIRLNIPLDVYKRQVFVHLES